MGKKFWKYILVLGCVFILSTMAVTQPKVHQIKISEGFTTHFYLYTYDSNGQLIYERKQIDTNSQRTNVEQTEWLMLGDTVGLQRKWTWNNGEWKVVHQIKSRFTNSIKTSEEFAHLNDGLESVYKRMIRHNSNPDYDFYGLAGNELKLIQTVRTNQETATRKKVNHTYFSGYSGLIPTASSSTTYVTDSLGRTDSILSEFAAPGQESEKYLIRTFYTGTDTIPSVIQVRRWNPLTYIWENQSRTSYKYTPEGKLAEELYEYFREMRWIATHRYSYSYYPEGVLQEKTIFGSIYRQWRRLSTIEYGNISEGYPRTVRSAYNFWGGTTGSDAITDIPYYFNGLSVSKKASAIEIEYLSPSKVEIPMNDDSPKVVLYPNPSNGLLFMAESHLLIRSWEVYDMQGRRLQQFQPDYPSNRIDISTYPAGMYLIRLVDSENQYRMQKITKY